LLPEADDGQIDLHRKFSAGLEISVNFASGAVIPAFAGLPPGHPFVAETMQIDPQAQPKADNYKLLTNLVVPRPIAWITSMGAGGVVNLAPFSFFNAVGSDPLYVVVGIGARDHGAPKDTGRNIDSRREFVVNLVTEDLVAAMNVSAADFPPDESEIDATGLQTALSARIGVPRLALSQASLECRLHQVVHLGSGRLYIAEVVMFHVADHLVGPRMHIHDFAPIGRLGSPSMYCRTKDRFELPRVNYAQWREENGSAVER
jgi:flavin reductase (DIM6/NTAB) family NADH-FMN oxidoreductase RutF